MYFTYATRTFFVVFIRQISETRCTLRTSINQIAWRSCMWREWIFPWVVININLGLRATSHCPLRWRPLHKLWVIRDYRAQERYVDKLIRTAVIQNKRTLQTGMSDRAQMVSRFSDVNFMTRTSNFLHLWHFQSYLDLRWTLCDRILANFSTSFDVIWEEEQAIFFVHRDKRVHCIL